MCSDVQHVHFIRETSWERFLGTFRGHRDVLWTSLDHPLEVCIARVRSRDDAYVNALLFLGDHHQTSRQNPQC